jgi:hypothetical protein
MIDLTRENNGHGTHLIFNGDLESAPARKHRS